MDYLKQFSIPFKGILDGLHEYEFELDQTFFEHFEGSPIDKSKITILMKAEKQSSLMSIELFIKGWMLTFCDRCLTEIKIPLESSYQLIVKKAEGESTDPELYHIHPDTSQWMVAELLYEYSCLSVPIIKAMDCGSLQNPPCNMDILNRIQKEENNLEQNPILEELKRLNLK
ncbi:MAG: hypothetical protein IT267_07475 [Saprospiraceae bacterium]|nr:hypothetical protein [Saprospiraceae bacterium]